MNVLPRRSEILTSGRNLYELRQVRYSDPPFWPGSVAKETQMDTCVAAEYLSAPAELKWCSEDVPCFANEFGPAVYLVLGVPSEALVAFLCW